MIRIFILLFSSILFIRCANIVPPTGGPRDTEAPNVLSEYPQNGTTNYKENYLTVTFDEPIVDNQLSSKVMVSPNIEGNYTVKIKKNTLKLIWSDTLKSNTTYTFNLADGIKDNTENNSIQNYSVTFSTGKDIDSNKVEAYIKNVPGKTSNSNVKLLLFEKTDSIKKLIKQRPEYISNLSNDSGKVEINYVKENTYTVIALDDYNKNNQWDIMEPVDIQQITIKNIVKQGFNLQNTVLDTGKVILMNSIDKTVNILFNKGLQKIEIKDQNGLYVGNKISDRKYSIENEYNLSDSTKIQISFVDSLGISGRYSKTIKFKTIDIQKDKDSIINITTIHKKKILKPKIDSIQFKTDHIIDSINPIITAPKYVTYRIINNYNNFTIIFSGQKQDDSIEIKLPYKSMHSIYNEYNKEYTLKITTAQEKEYGNIQFEIKTENQNYTTYIQNWANEIVYSSKNQKINTIKNIEAGAYKLFVHVDTNNDGYWNASDPFNNTPAEPIYYFKEDLIIRANWDLEDIQMIF
jgi:uncharacterized protein (DUF2141 family)